VIRDGILEEVRWEEIVVGDIVRVEQDEFFPSDLVCLSTSEPAGLCYIETSQLDGETNLKIRRALPATSDYTSLHDLSNLYSTITCQPPNNQLYKFVGKFKFNDKEKEHAIEVEQILLRGAKLKNTKYIYGISIYTGKHSKLMMNSEDAPHKMSKMEKVTNYAILGLFVLQFILTIICAIGSAVWQEQHINMWYLFHGDQLSSVALGFQGLITFYILYHNFIPISLYVSMEFVKMLQARWMIDNDVDMYYAPADMPAVAKTSSLNEELGQVEYIFSDKTGTLTQNVMEFLKFSVDGVIYGRGTTEIGRAAAKRNNIDLCDDRPKNWQTDVEGLNFYDERILNRKWRQERCAKSIKTFFTLLAVCHTVIPEADKRDPSKIFYQAASPDEGALVNAAAGLGFKFLKRTPTSVTIDADGEEETYQVLNVLEFNSTRKRMSVIVRTPDQKIKLLTKGADNVIYKLMKPSPYSDITLKNLKQFAEEGLRTLVCAQVELDPEFYHDWNKNVFEKANTALVDKEEAVSQAAEMVEKNLELVGATAIEDKLQDGVPMTISELAKAGIKIWVLTGDKQETAINIGYACALLDNRMGIMIFNDTNRARLKAEIRNSLHMAENGEIMGESGLAVIIDGASLDLVLQKNSWKEHALEPTIVEKHHHHDQQVDDVDLPGEETLAVTFLKLCMLCRSVVCCRVSPLQKALVVKLVRDNLRGSVTLAIGDGANDVSMIQAAHIGIGISGQEGLQAARASDYAIGQFRFLRKLLLVHGRYNYRRIGRLISYSFYKNITLQLCQFWYVWYNAFTGRTIYDSILLLLFNLIFSAVPIMTYAVFDRDVSPESSMAIPQLYILGQRSYYLNMRLFTCWILSAIWHSIVCFFIPCLVIEHASYIFSGSPPEYDLLSYMVYTNVVMIITFKLGIESSTWTVVHHVSFYGSILSWFLVAMIYATLWPGLQAILPYSLEAKGIDMINFIRSAYYVFFNVTGNWLFWLTIFIAVIFGLLRDIVWKCIVTNVTFGTHLRQIYHVIRDMEYEKEPVKESTVLRKYPGLNDLHPPLRRLPEGKYFSDRTIPYQQAEPIIMGEKFTAHMQQHTGYSFSQTEGGQAELVRTASLKRPNDDIFLMERQNQIGFSVELETADDVSEMGTPLV
jgi:magnesium-transporting ATPase (P-type)